MTNHFSNIDYVCGECGNQCGQSGIFVNKKCPYDQSQICHICKTDTPNIVTKKEWDEKKND